MKLPLLFAFALILLLTGCTSRSAAQSQPLQPEKSAADAFTFNAYAELGDYPLDQALKACLDADPGTSGITRCYNEFLKQYEAQLNRNYNRVEALLGPASAQLQASQALWEKHYTAELALIEAQYKGLTGTQYAQLMAIERLLPVRARCLQLHLYAQALSADRE